MTGRRRILVFNDAFTSEDLQDITPRGIELVCIPDGDRARLLELIPGFDAYFCTLRIRVDAEVVRRAARLRLIATPSTGTDHLDLALLRESGIKVFSLKHDRQLLDRISSTAELAFGLLLTCARHLPLCLEAARQGRWERDKFAGRQLAGKTLGIVGLGRLGSMMARYGRAFRMKVIASDPRPAPWPRGIERVGLRTLLARADFVSLHVHLTEKTRGLLGARELALLRPGASLINTSRGGLIDEQALIREMRSGRIASAGLDVIDGEWLEDKSRHPLVAYSRSNPRLYITPHVGGTCPEAVLLAARHTFRKMIRFLRSPLG